MNKQVLAMEILFAFSSIQIEVNWNKFLTTLLYVYTFHFTSVTDAEQILPTIYCMVMVCDYLIIITNELLVISYQSITTLSFIMFLVIWFEIKRKEFILLTNDNGQLLHINSHLMYVIYLMMHVNCYLMYVIQGLMYLI